MEKIIQLQKEFFRSGKTLNLEFRRRSLLKLKDQMVRYYSEIIEAFKKDFNKCEFDVVTTEIFMVNQELNYMLKNLKRLAKPKRVGTGILNFKSRGYILKEPYGVTLIVSPWNYPLHLSLLPLVDAIATGNTIVLKPSRNTPNVSEVIKKICSCFGEQYVYITYDNEHEREVLFDQRFDFVFYTGSPAVAKNLMERQGKYLTPMVLELGGKSPVIVDEDADIERSAKRIVWGKFLNAGQTCVAPDYLFVHKSLKEKLINKMVEYVDKFYYKNGEITEDFPYLVQKRNLEKTDVLLKCGKIECGGKRTDRLLEPTILSDVKLDSEIMKNEIFAPILPVIEFEKVSEVIDYVRANEKPLALYYFGKKNEKKVLDYCSFGGGCVNETIMHLCEDKLPFGGVGNSGVGNYHGEKSFSTFSHEKSILKKGKLELNLKYPPYSSKKLNFIKKFFRIKDKF